MAGADLVALRDRIERAVSDAIAAGELGDTRMTGPWVFFMDGYDEDGDRVLTQAVNDDNRFTDALGLIRLAEICFEEQVRAWWQRTGG